MTAVEIATIAQPLVAALVGAGQIAVIWYGIRAMIGANQDRADGSAEAALRADQRHAEAARQADQRHAEAARQADQRHAEAMAALGLQAKHAAAQSAALEAQTAALETLIERTAPRQ